MTFTEDQQQRYARHLNLPGFGPEAQQRLMESSVLLIGSGGLGSPIALYLAAAGVGTIGIADGDRIELSNLQRQIIHTTAELGIPKTMSAERKITALNPDARVVTYPEYITAENAPQIFPAYDFIIDATDSLDAKFLIDRLCQDFGKPYSHGAIQRYEGHTMTILPDTARFTDLFPDGPEAVVRTEPRGPLGVLPGIIGTIQASEAIKYLAGIGELLTDRLLRVDLLTMQFTTIRLR